MHIHQIMKARKGTFAVIAESYTNGYIKALDKPVVCWALVQVEKGDNLDQMGNESPDDTFDYTDGYYTRVVGMTASILEMLEVPAEVDAEVFLGYRVPGAVDYDDAAYWKDKAVRNVESRKRWAEEAGQEKLTSKD